MTSSLHHAGFAEGTSGLIAAAGSVVVMAVRITLGAWSDRTPRDAFPLVATMMMLGALGFGVMSSQGRAPLLAGGLVAYAAGWGWPGLFNLAIAQANPSGPAAASGVTQTGTYLGVATGPLLFGWLAEHVGYGAAFVSAAAGAALGAVCIVVGRRRVVPVAAAASPDSWSVPRA